MLYPDLKQRDSLHDTWEHIQKLIINYWSARIRETNHSNSNYLDSFVFPISLIERFDETNIDDVYFALGYHNDSHDRILKSGITLILFGVNSNDQVMFGNDDVIWDLNSMHVPLSSFPNQNISQTNALTAIANYQSLSMKKFHTTYLKNNVDFTEDLKGLRIKLLHLREFLGRQTPVSEIECIFGLHGDYSEKNNQKGHTLAFIGIDNNGSGRLTNTISDPDTPPTPDKDIAFDYCDPCPRNCPENF